MTQSNAATAMPAEDSTAGPAGVPGPGGGDGRALRALFEGRFQEYVELVADDGRALWVLLHIPKTAGSSFRAEMAQALRPQINVHINHHDLSVPPHVQMDQAFDRFLATHAEQPYRFASGHFTNRHAAQVLERAPQSRLLTVLRHPVERVISEYRYQRTEAHPSHRDFCARFPTFRDFYNAPLAQNAMTRYLAPQGGGDADAAIEFVCANYSFVGLVEMYPLTVKTVFALLGYDHRPRLHIRKTSDLTEDPLEVSDDDRREIRALNHDDLAVFGFFTEKLKRVRDGFINHLKQLELRIFEFD